MAVPKFPQFSEQQLKDFRSFVKVQKSNRYNMLGTQAQAAVGIATERYLFVIEHYDALDLAARPKD